MSGLYQLRRADHSVQLAVVLFLLVLGYAYVFAFLMVRHWAGLTPGDVKATYVPERGIDTSELPPTSRVRTRAIDLAGMQERHQVDTDLLIQDSHIHVLMFGVVAALQSIIVLGLGWRRLARDAVISAGFGAGVLDFSGQWLMKAGLGGFAWLTIASGWLMAAVYMIVLGGTLRCVLARGARPDLERT